MQRSTCSASSAPDRRSGGSTAARQTPSAVRSMKKRYCSRLFPERFGRVGDLGDVLHCHQPRRPAREVEIGWLETRTRQIVPSFRRCRQGAVPHLQLARVSRDAWLAASCGRSSGGRISRMFMRRNSARV